MCGDVGIGRFSHRRFLGIGMAQPRSLNSLVSVCGRFPAVRGTGIFSSEQGTFAGGTRNSLTQNSIMGRPVMRDDRNSCGRGATRGADVVSRLVARAGAFWPREDQISIVGLFLL